MQGPLGAALQRVKGGCLLGGPASGYDEVVGGFKQLLDEFEPDPTRCSGQTDQRE